VDYFFVQNWTTHSCIYPNTNNLIYIGIYNKQIQDVPIISCFSCERLCCNPSLGFATKARAYKGVGQEGNMGVTSHALKSVGECEGMNVHTLKWAPILGVGVPMDSQISKEQFKRPKSIGLKNSLYHWKA